MPIIYVTGETGTGKTTIGQLIAQHYGIEFIEISTLVTTEKLYEEYDEERQCYIMNEEAVVAKLVVLASQKKCVISGPLLALPPEQISAIVVLSASSSIVRQRLMSRNYPAEKITENIEALLFGVSLGQSMEYYPDKPLIEIDTSNITPINNVATIIERLDEIHNI